MEAKKTYDLITRTCLCGKEFKVLSTSPQMHHSEECRLKDPNYVPKPVEKKKADLNKIVDNIEKGATLSVPVKDDLERARVQRELRKKEKELYEETPESKWGKAVEEAKRIVGQMQTSRIRIAELALSVCEIQYGGNWRAFARIYTVQNFAKDIGVHPKTLHQWIRIKKNIHDQLPEGEWVDDWGLAVRVDHKVGSKPAKLKVVETYRKEKNRNKSERRFRTVSRSISSFVHLLGKKDALAKVSKDDLVEAYEMVTVLKRSIKERLSGYKEPGGNL